MSKRIAVFSGGGVKGYLTMRLLELMPKEMQGDYDTYIGTSVGAIIATALAIGIPPETMKKDFIGICEKIFGKPKKFPPLYSNTAAIKVLNDYFNAQLPKLKGDQQFITTKQLKKKLIITSTDLVEDEECFLHAEDVNISLGEFCCFSFTAPFYFDKWIKLDKTKNHLTFWSDGGVGAMNLPITAGIMESLNYPNEVITLHAFGTGTVQKDREKEFAHLQKTKWIREVGDYLSIKTGGFARKASQRAQINYGLYWAKHTGNDFVFFDAIIRKDISLNDFKAVANAEFGFDMERSTSKK
jgi:patatin-like phospholipase/acyl hydrolase